MHPLCCISLESPNGSVGDRSASSSLWRARSLPTGFLGGSAGNAGGSESSMVGVLYKWTNYGKGWRSRWFILRNGVMSYAKIRRPDNLNLLALATDDVKLIGEISANRLSRMDSGIANRCFRRYLHKKRFPLLAKSWFIFHVVSNCFAR
jgi:hypothetical protein